MKKDVIINVFSCSEQAPCNKWASEFFTDPPLIINVAGSGSATWRAKVTQWAKTGDLFMAAVKETYPNLKDIEIGKRGLTTFSAGWNFADEFLKYDNEVNRLDAYILLDGCHTKILTNWIKFAKRAANKEALLLMAHSSIVPSFISSTDSNTQILDGTLTPNNINAFDYSINIPEYISKATLEQPITISLAAAYQNGKLVLPKITKTWTTDPLLDVHVNGNVARLHYSGNDRPDHVYIAWYVSKRLWKWLGSIWSIKVEEKPLIPVTPDVIAPAPLPEPDIVVDSIPKTEKSALEQKNVFQMIVDLIQSMFGKIRINNV